jgi:transposase
MPFEGAATRVASLRGLLERYEDELDMVERQLHGRLPDHKG